MARIGTFELIPPDQWLFPNHGDVAEARRRAESWREANGTYDGAEFAIEELPQVEFTLAKIDRRRQGLQPLTFEAVTRARGRAAAAREPSTRLLEAAE